jgi:hypothetical protein
MAQHSATLSFPDFMFQKWLQGFGLAQTAISWNKLHPDEPTTVATVQRYFAAYANGGDAADLKRGEPTTELPPTPAA